MSNPTNKIRVLIVDDSAIIRSLLTRFLSSDPEIEVVGTAPDPFVAREKLVALKPDVMTLDIEMPRMDGVTFLEKVMQHFPIRTLMISSLSARGTETALRALEAGAIDVMGKPAIDVTKSMESLATEIVMRVKNVARARLKAPSSNTNSAARAPVVKPKSGALAKSTHQILAIAASTGGTVALKEVLSRLPADIPGTVIVQHMPPGFTSTFAKGLNDACAFEVKEAEEGDAIIPGRALLAPGNFHMEIIRSGGYYSVKLHQEPLLHGVRPAADYLMKSVAHFAGSNAIGVILTGMGKDGAEGLLAMKNAGAYTIGQNEQTCVVYGMPKVAFEIGAVQRVLPLEQIAFELTNRFQKD